MQFRASPAAIGAVLLTSTFCSAIACPSEHVNALELRAETTGAVSVEHGEKTSGITEPGTSIFNTGEPLAPLEAEIASPNWMLLLDHEGESFTFYAGDYTSESEQVAGEPARSASHASARVPNLGLVLDEDVAFIFSEFYEAAYPASTGSSSTVAEGLALVGFEDQ